MRGLEKNCMGRGHTNNTQTDFATTRLTRPREPSWWKIWGEATPSFLINSWHSTLYLLNLFVFRPKFGLFHQAKSPIYKRVELGQLAGPKLVQNSELTIFVFAYYWSSCCLTSKDCTYVHETQCTIYSNWQLGIRIIKNSSIFDY